MRYARSVPKPASGDRFGVLPPGAKVPSRHELARQYDVSDRVAVEAVRLLVAEGFAETRAGG